MKQILLIAIFLTSLLQAGYAQDKIITLSNDTIYCKITKVSEYTIYYEMNIQGVKTAGSVDHNRIFKYIISEETKTDGQKETEVSKNPFENSPPDIISKHGYHVVRVKIPREKREINREPFKRLRYSMDAGPGYLLGSTKVAEGNMIWVGLSEDQANSFYKEMKSGLHTSTDLTFFFTPNLGAGIKYKFFCTSAGLEGFFDTPDGYNLYYGKLNEQIYVNFIGGTFLYQHFLGKRKTFKLNSATSVGFTNYRNEVTYFTNSFLLTGKNIGADFSLGLEYFITGNFSVGTELSLFYSSIRKIRLSDGYTTVPVDPEKNYSENLSRLDLSLGIRVYLWNK